MGVTTYNENLVEGQLQGIEASLAKARHKLDELNAAHSSQERPATLEVALAPLGRQYAPRPQRQHRQGQDQAPGRPHLRIPLPVPVNHIASLIRAIFSHRADGLQVGTFPSSNPSHG